MKVGDVVEIAVPSLESKWLHGLEVGTNVRVHQVFEDEPRRMTVEVGGELRMVLPAEVRSVQPAPAQGVVTDAVTRLVKFWRDNAVGGVYGSINSQSRADAFRQCANDLEAALAAEQASVPAAEVFRIAGGDTECCPNPSAKAALDCLSDLRQCYDEALDSVQAKVPDGWVIDALNDGFTVHKNSPSSFLTDAANAELAWTVGRSERPFCDASGARQWHGPSLREAIATARNALGIAAAPSPKVEG